MPRTRREQLTFPITTRTLEVLRAADVTPGMRRVTLGGPQLQAFEANGYPVGPFRTDGFDDEFKIFFTAPGDDAPVLPVQGDGVIEWPRNPPALSRTYTVRRYDRERGEVDVDVVRHGTGVAATWAERCVPGDPVTIAGPKMSWLQPEGVDWVLILGDETALPAIARWLEEMAPGVRAQVFVEIAHDDHRQELKTDADVQVTWLSRDDAPAGTTTLLLDAARGAEWWPGSVYAWAAGEALTLAPIRRWLRREKELPAENVEVVGYWRRVAVQASAADPAVPEQAAEPDDAAGRLHELTELVPPFAIRVAVTVGLVDALGGGPLTTAEAARRTGTDPRALAMLLRFLGHLDVVSETDGRFGLGPVGRELVDDEVAAGLHLEGAAALRDLAVVGLLESVRTGRASYAGTFGRPFADVLDTDDTLGAQHLEDVATWAGYLSPALAAEPVFGEVGRLRVLGEGLAAHLPALVTAWPELVVEVHDRPSRLALLERDLARRLDDAARSRVHLVPSVGAGVGGPADADPGGGAHVGAAGAGGAGAPSGTRSGAAPGAAPGSLAPDAVLLADALAELPDDDAAHLLREASRVVGPGGRVLVVEERIDHATAYEHDHEEQLVRLSLTGGGRRTADEHRALAGAAGLAVDDERTVGWGVTLSTLRPAPR